MVSASLGKEGIDLTVQEVETDGQQIKRFRKRSYLFHLNIYGYEEKALPIEVENICTGEHCALQLNTDNYSCHRNALRGIETI